MKIRNGFVSNSSSSSYTCEICNNTESGFDCGPEDCGFGICTNEHCLCIDCFMEGKPKPPEDEETYEQWSEETKDGNYYPEECCPICQFIEPSSPDTANYLLKEYGISRDEVFQIVKQANKRRKKLYDHEYITYVCQKHNVNLIDLLPKLKQKFGTYSEFQKYLWDKSTNNEA